ncbi:MAG: RidA family protein [Chitinophagaceae bacterium]|nr:RidA family protein [Chitinophagaceae bacterium]
MIAVNIEQKLTELGHILPSIPPSKGVYKSTLEVGNLLYTSGHVSINTDGSFITGKCGNDVSDEEARRAAQQCGLAILASIKKHFGSLDRIKRVVKILGMVNAVPDYTKHAIVINGCSDLFVQLWGDDNGKGVRSAVGMGSLPNNVAVEIEAIFEFQST